MAFGHSSPAQLIHQSREDAAAVAFVSQSVKHDEADGIQLRQTRVLQQPPDVLEGDTMRPGPVTESLTISYRLSLIQQFIN